MHVSFLALKKKTPGGLQRLPPHISLLSHNIILIVYLHFLCSFSSILTWNVRGKDGIVKREEVVDVFRKGKFELLALTETKLKGNG